MNHTFDVPAACLNLWQECQALVPELLRGTPQVAQDIALDTDTPFTPKPGAIYLVRQGAINERFDGQLIVTYEVGDLVHVDALFHAKNTTYDTDFPTFVDMYDGQKLLDSVTTDKSKFQLATRYFVVLTQSFQLLMCHFSRQDTEYIPEFREYKKGDVIIQEDTEGDEVFTLLHGSAKVVKNNEEIGEIKKDEIFGAIAALTHTKRSATIIATSNCDALVATSDTFRSILATRPDVVQKLLQNMARTIVSNNERIIELSKNQN